MPNTDKNNANRYYEIGYLLSPTLPESDAADLETTFHSAITNEDGEIVASESPEMRELSYEIEVKNEGSKQQFSRGQFGWVQFSLPASSTEAVEDTFVNNSDVLRHLLISVDEEDLAPNRSERADESEEETEAAEA